MNSASENIIPDGFICQLEKRLGLTYMDEAGEGNVCFANNNDELRDDFKQVFTRKDVLKYISKVKAEQEIIPLPENEKAFWEIVKSV